MDNFGRVLTEAFPNNFKVQRNYHALGYQTHTEDITDAANPKTLWRLANTTDTRGNLTQQLWGNGVVTQTRFDAVSGQLDRIPRQADSGQ